MVLSHPSIPCSGASSGASGPTRTSKLSPSTWPPGPSSRALGPSPVTRPDPLLSAAHAPLIPYCQAVLVPFPLDGMPPVLPHAVHCQGPAQLMSCLIMKSLGPTHPAMEWGGLLASQLVSRQLGSFPLCGLCRARLGPDLTRALSKVVDGLECTCLWESRVCCRDLQAQPAEQDLASRGQDVCSEGGDWIISSLQLGCMGWFEGKTQRPFELWLRELPWSLWLCFHKASLFCPHLHTAPLIPAG